MSYISPTVRRNYVTPQQFT